MGHFFCRAFLTRTQVLFSRSLTRKLLRIPAAHRQKQPIASLEIFFHRKMEIYAAIVDADPAAAARAKRWLQKSCDLPHLHATARSYERESTIRKETFAPSETCIRTRLERLLLSPCSEGSFSAGDRITNTNRGGSNAP